MLKLSLPYRGSQLPFNDSMSVLIPSKTKLLQVGLLVAPITGSMGIYCPDAVSLDRHAAPSGHGFREIVHKERYRPDVLEIRN